MTVAFVLVMSKKGREQEVVDELSKLDSVKEAGIVYGDYDVVAKVEINSVDELNGLVLSHIRNVDSISSTKTLISL